MPSASRKTIANIVPKAALLLLAVGINTVEYLFPRIPFLPWLKPGLANAVTIIWIVRWGAADALLFTVLRSWITSFYFGFSLVSLMLSMSGGLAAAIGMGALWTCFGRRGWLGLVGLGIAGAALHNAGQLCALYFLLTAAAGIWYQVPFMLAASLVFGAATGVLAHALMPLLAGSDPKSDFAGLREPPTRNFALRLVAGGLLLGASIGVVFLHAWPLLAASAAAASVLAVAVAERGKLSVLFYPIGRFWLLFVFVAVMNIFFSYGRSAFGLSFVTQDGLRETVLAVAAFMDMD